MQILKDTLMFGGYNLSQYLAGIKIDRPLMADIEINQIDVNGRNGTILNGNHYKPLYITVTATLNAKKATDVATVRKNLAFYLKPAKNNDGLKVLTLPDDPTMKYDAIVTGSTALDRGYGYPHVGIEFMVPDGTGYTQERTLSSGGSIVVDGNVETYPVFTFTSVNGEVTITYTSTATGTTKTFSFVGVGNSFTIDMSTGKITAPYVGAIASLDMDNDYFALQPGAGTLTWTGNGTCTFKERWL